MQPAEAWPEGSDFHKCVVGDSDLGPYFPAAMQSMCSSSETSAEAKGVAASNNHKEAEKRRRQRINSHLDTLRNLLPACNSRTDKASLLAKVVQQVKELKQQSSQMMQLESSFPSDSDDVIVVTDFLYHQSSLVIKASFCCDDRSDLITELIQTLKSLRLSLLKAEMVTFGGRTRNVLILSTDKIDQDKNEEVVEFLKQELRLLVHRSSSTYHLGDRFKRQRRIIN